VAKHFTQRDLQLIVKLKEVDGLSHKEIAEKLGRLDGNGKPATRSVMKQYKKAKSQGITTYKATSSPIPKDEVPGTVEKPLNEMGRNERVQHLRSIIPGSPRGKYIYEHVLNDVEREMFEEEYFRIIKEEDSFTAAEEGILFMAILHWTLAMRAWKRDKNSYDRSPQNGYVQAMGGPPPSIYTDQWTKEAKDNMKTYESMMKSLKLNREQRLKEIQRMGTTFLDFAERVAKTNEQERIADEILKLEHMSEKELKKIQEKGWMIAGGLPNNSPCQYEAENVKETKDVSEE